ncbi:MAG: hypothetical protein WAZ60_23755 [Desulfosalsimonadaceae bacterium]
MNPIDLLKKKLTDLGKSDLWIKKALEAHPGIEKEIQKPGSVQVVAWKLVMEEDKPITRLTYEDVDKIVQECGI